MKSTITILLALLPLNAFAQDLVEFENGQLANADDINSNFQVLDDKLKTVLDDPTARDNQWGRLEIAVDCSENQYALQTAFSENLHKDRITFAIEGGCVFDDVLDVAARFISFAGEIDADNATCALPMPQLITGAGVEDAETSILVNNSGTLLFTCMTLGDADRSEGRAVIQAFANSMIRMDRVVESPTGNLVVNVRQASLFRYLAYTYEQGFTGELYSRMGKAEIYGNNDIRILGLNNGAKFNCLACGGGITSGAMSGGSEMYIRAQYGPVVVDEMNLEPGSQIYTEEVNDNPVTISNLYYRNPEDFNRTIYTGSELAPAP